MERTSPGLPQGSSGTGLETGVSQLQEAYMRWAEARATASAAAPASPRPVADKAPDQRHIYKGPKALRIEEENS